MKILVTGGRGYVGGRLAQYLECEAGHRLLIGSRSSSSTNNSTSKAKAVHTVWDSQEKLQEICNGIDAVIHLAGMNSTDCAANPIAAVEANILATAKLVNAAAIVGVKRFIFFSTAHIYKSPLEGVITEETLPSSLHPYATSHKAAEDVVRAAHMRGEIEGIVIRLSNSFGSPITKEANCWMLLANDLCRQAVTTRAMVLRSSGNQRRDFITMTDVCRAVSHLLHTPIEGSDKNIFNVGGDWSPTVWELACFIQESCKKTLGFEPTLTRSDPTAGEKKSDLDFRIDRLKATGFTLFANSEEEISNLLKFCHASFSNK